MKFEKNKTTKQVANAPLIGGANQNLLNKVNSPAARIAKTVSAKPDREYVAPTHDTVNTQGFGAYTKDAFTTLLTLLNTLKLDGDQFYRTENKAVQDVLKAVEESAMLDPYFTAQAIRYSRVNGEGLRSVTQLAAAHLAKFLSGKEFARYFYGRYDRKNKVGGVIYRIDDAVQVANAYFGLTKAKSLPNSIRKGFVAALESADTYELAKYKNSGLVDLINLVHPNQANSTAVVEVDGEKYRAILNAKASATKDASKKTLYTEKIVAAKGKTVTIKTLDALMLGVPFTADTHETRNTQAGQIVAEAKKTGKITEREAVALMEEAIGNNFKELLQNGKLGMLALVRNLVRMVTNKVDAETVKMVVAMLTNGDAIRKSLVHPMQLDLAYEMLLVDHAKDATARTFMTALQKGFELAMPNFALTGRVCVMVDVSGSMTATMMREGSRTGFKTRACDKAFLVAAVLAKASNADIVLFDTNADKIKYTPTLGVFDLAKEISKVRGFGGGTTIAAPFNYITNHKLVYDKIVLLSDNEANGGNTARAAESYFRNVNCAMVYSVDLASYGTTQLKGDNVFELYGYGFSMFEDMAKREYNANAHMAEVRKVRFKNAEM